ncbi:MAG TPA: hypothetical protein PLT27_13000, partial [Nitrospira sp.]|nr:hypothetical protein [Nitrospira sp.]
LGAMGPMVWRGSRGGGRASGDDWVCGGWYEGDSMGSMGSMGTMGMMGSMGGGMMGSMGGGMGMSAATQPEYKMVRCYDMLNPARDYAKVYRYRIRLLMRDPNYPDDGRLPRPAPNTLTDEAWARVAPLIAKEDAEVKANPSFMRTLRKTAWSEPSPPARVEIPIEVFAGDVEFEGPRTFETDGKAFTLTVSEPTASVVATVMDSSTGARLAMQRDVRRGSVLTDKADLELIVPSTGLVKIDKDKQVDARATIVDIRGGKPLAGNSRDDPLSDIGEMLILNRDGSMSVATEFDDTFLVRMYTFADEHEQAEKSSSSSSTNAYGGGYGDAGGGSGGSGDGGRGR